MENRRTPEEDHALSSILNATGGKLSVMFPPRSLFSRPLSLFPSYYDRSCSINMSRHGPRSRSPLSLQRPRRPRLVSPVYTQVLLLLPPSLILPFLPIGIPVFLPIPPFRTLISHVTIRIPPRPIIRPIHHHPRSTLLLLLPPPSCPTHPLLPPR